MLNEQRRKTIAGELVDLNELQPIQDSFAKTVGTSSVILSPAGEPLTQFSNPTGFCSLIQSTEEGKRRCFLSFMEMSQKALALEEPIIQYCFVHGGHFVAPIVIDGEHKGTMFAGQFIPQTFSVKQLKALEKIAVEIHVDPTLLVEEAKKMRVVEEDAVRNYSSLLFQIVAVITRLGAQADELNRAKDALQKAHNGLEIRVQERTTELAIANEGLEQEIRERKKAEETLSESEIRFRELFDNMSSGVAIYAAKEGGKDFVFINFNHAAEKIESIKKEDLLGKSVLEVFPGVMDFGLFDVFQRVLHTGKPEHLPISFYKDERIVGWRENYVYKLPSGGIVTVYEDITERKQAEDALRESEEKVRSITASAQDAVIMVDNDETISFWNEAAERIFGYTEQEMIGTKLHSAIIPERFHEDALTGFKSFRETGQGAAVGKTLELAANRKDGTEFPVELSLSAVKLKGKWNGIGVIRDISEVRKKTEAMKRFNKLAVNRELRMIELKKEINTLLEDLGKEARYKIAGEGGR